MSRARCCTTYAGLRGIDQARSYSVRWRPESSGARRARTKNVRDAAAETQGAVGHARTAILTPSAPATQKSPRKPRYMREPTQPRLGRRPAAEPYIAVADCHAGGSDKG